MNVQHLDKQISADTGRKKQTARNGLKPIYFDGRNLDDVSKYYNTIISICGEMWTLMGYSGLMTPWHEVDPKRELNFQKNHLQKLISTLNDMDVSVEAYCVVCCSISSHDKYQRPIMLLGQRAHWSWVKKLRSYAKSRERTDDVAKLILEFIRLQVEHIGRAYINSSTIIKSDPSGKGKFLSAYHKMIDRINQLDSKGINPLCWMKKKFMNGFEAVPDGKVYFNTIVNINGFEPDLEKLSEELSDPWNEIKRFLGLPNDCLFSDGFIPKGWNVASDDPAELKNVVKITGDGFYYHRNGSQRRGKRHYASNKYFIIKCDHTNFGEFRNDWNKVTLLSSKPTWEEYSRWAMFPNVWDETGKSLIYTKDIKWRKS